MKKATTRRLLLGIMQHLAFAIVIMLIVIIAQRSIIRPESVHTDNRLYQLDVIGREEEFEETQAFYEMFRDTASNLTTFAVIKAQMETDGVYDNTRLVDVTAFVNRKERVSDCKITAVYYLDDLIKWSKSGIEMRSYSMTRKEFVNFFGDGMIDITHFYLDEEGELIYQGEIVAEPADNGTEASVSNQETETKALPQQNIGDKSAMENEMQDQTALEQSKLEETYYNYLLYNEEELVNMAFKYLVSHMDKPVEMLVDHNDQELVQFEMINPLYAAANGELQLTRIANNWLEYSQLENNLVDTIESLSQNYVLYENWSKQYSKSNSNVTYLFRVPNGNGTYSNYTNMNKDYLSDIREIENYFEDIGRFISYSVEDIECTGNVDITDEEMFRMVDTHKYAYPSGTRIWIGVDTSYAVHGDLFYNGQQVFCDLISNIERYFGMIGLFLLLWLMMLSYLTYTAGEAIDEKGKEVRYLNSFDRLYTEFILVLCILLTFVGYRTFRGIVSLAVDAEENTLLVNWDFMSAHVSTVKEFLPGIGACYGFLASFLFCIMWYSLARRIKCNNLIRDSLVYRFFQKLYQTTEMILTHRNITVRTLLPYNLFLVMNFLGLAVFSAMKGKGYISTLVLMGVLLADALIGVFLFRKNAEMADIMDAIKKIRQGDMDQKLEIEKMHGENKEIAEAVNNIGDGIKHAVETSMKDERLKTDLITNVSHDIKTPLTSIISYVDLLKRQKIETEPAKSYIEILDSKSQRLKQLTDDLVESSKISSGNIVLQNDQLNLTELFNQAIGEFSEKLEEKQLQVIFPNASMEAMIYADSSRMWRIIENLFNNIYKYAMPASRIYIDVQKENGMIRSSIKNISQQRLDVGTQELTERFFRGDTSRTSEGSGLGLYITKCLTQAQNGEFEIQLDGDLFKAVLTFPEYIPEEEKI